MITETAKKPTVRKVSTERLHVVVSPKFKHYLFEGAAQLEMNATELIKNAVREYLQQHLQQSPPTG